MQTYGGKSIAFHTGHKLVLPNGQIAFPNGQVIHPKHYFPLDYGESPIGNHISPLGKIILLASVATCTFSDILIKSDMDTDDILLNKATNGLQALPFGAIIGAPLKACIEAQAMAAMTSWRFIQEVGLQTNSETGDKEVMNVSFLFTQKGETAQINVPLLTVVPIPYIAVQQIDISFKANISASKSASENEEIRVDKEANINAHGKLGFGIFSLESQMEASYSSKKDSKATQESRYSVEYTMDVAIKAGQEDMPAGLAKILEILNNNVEITSK